MKTKFEKVCESAAACTSTDFTSFVCSFGRMKFTAGEKRLKGLIVWFVLLVISLLLLLF